MRGIILVTLVWALGCGEADAPLGPPGGLDTVELAPFPGWPDDVATRTVGQAFRTSALRLELAPGGHVWLLREEWTDQSAFGAPVLERYRMNGRLDRRVELPAGALVPDFVVHPSGELSVFVLHPEADPAVYRLELARLSAEGERLSSTEFHDVARPRENLYYDENGVHELPTDRPLRFGRRSHLVGLADGEGLYLLACCTYGAKLYRVGENHAQVWSAQIMPPNIGMAFHFWRELLATDEDGRVYVAYQIYEDDLSYYNQHFGRAPLEAVDSYDVLLERFEPDGAFSSAQVFGGAGGDVPTGMTARQGKVLLSGSVRRTKHDLPNRTMEWDLFVLRGDMDASLLLDYRTLDLARDDFARDMVETADGTIYLAGRHDYVQVDTNSEVEDGKGLLLALSPDFTRQKTMALPGPRDVQLHTLRRSPDGRLIFAGTRNGPLTHTDPAMLFNNGVLGATRLDLPE